jgi:hypothetical protein
MITHEVKSKGYFGIKVVQEIQISILWNWDEGRSKVERMVTSYRSRQQGMSEGDSSAMLATTSAPRTRNEENRFPAR